MSTLTYSYFLEWGDWKGTREYWNWSVQQYSSVTKPVWRSPGVHFLLSFFVLQFHFYWCWWLWFPFTVPPVHFYTLVPLHQPSFLLYFYIMNSKRSQPQLSPLLPPKQARNEGQQCILCHELCDEKQKLYISFITGNFDLKYVLDKNWIIILCRLLF